ncbi:hypothetical protein KUTeg_003444 [Tegillarca granosa]|uniref:ERCC4 domain-containing protein n=1 Tax=Tegillarca granosa TaxID=220873 RepID=A0ABQ9FM67_TEGGR|nr:hypothetical protein KUTeg_003444 [Tegillarca granosa]
MDLPLASRIMGIHNEANVTKAKEDELNKHYNNLSDTDVNSDSDVDFPLPSNSVLKKNGTNYVRIHGESSDTDVNSDQYSDIELEPLKCNNIKSNKGFTKENFKEKVNSLEENEDECIIDLDNCGSLRERILNVSTSLKQKTLENSSGTSKILSNSYTCNPIKKTENGIGDLNTHSSVQSKINSCDRISPLTISDNSNDAYQGSDNEICLIERESLSTLISKSGASCTSDSCEMILTTTSQTSNYSDNTDEVIPAKKFKRSKEEIEEKKRIAQYLKVILDPHIVNECGLGAAIFSVCEKLGVSCHTEEQKIPYTICWRRTLTECSVIGNQVEKINKEVTEDEIISVLPLSDFVEMVHTFKQAVTDTQLQTGSMVYMMETGEEIAEFIRTYTKAVAEKPANPDVAEALISVYPSPWLLMQDYKKCNSEKEAIRLLENIVVRRGAGVLETTRRVGKELSRRIYTAMTCSDPAFVIK